MGEVRVAFAGDLGGFRLDAAFVAPGTGVTAVFGPSGCGKTTVLRCLAGLHRVERGFCAVGGEVWQDGAMFVPAHRRAVGYVFQEASLFAHLSVRRNLLFGARGQEAIGFGEVVAMLGLERLLERSPGHLSGGERQRVAIGRALLSRPKLLLMDEPLAALDRGARDEVLPFLARVQQGFSLPIVYVSHDMAEVERLADHLVLMERGRVVASGALAELQSDASLPLAGERDAAVSIEGNVGRFDAEYGLLEVVVAGGVFLVPSERAAAGERRRLRVAARDVSVTTSPAASTIVNVLPARIVSVSDVGEHERLVLLALGFEGAGARMLARVTAYSWQGLGLEVGQGVHAQVKSVALG